MKQSTKRVLSIALCLMMVVSLLPGLAFADDTWVSITHGATGITASVSSGYESLSIGGSGNSFNITSTISGYFPQHFSLKLSDTNATVSGSNGAEFSFYNGQYGTVTMGSGAAVLTVSNAGGSFTIDVPAPNGGSTSGEGIYAFLPAPGQYVNENMTSGSWGSAYLSGQTGTKDLVDNIAQTGVSLGFFGGYVVLDYGADGIDNDPANKYGIDFILYGNAFNEWSEPGCVQVSQDASTWYDIAGSRYYQPNTVKNATLSYVNPTASDDDTTLAYGTPGTDLTGSPSGLAYNGTASGTIPYNTWHKHSWFPLFANYFKPVNGNPPLDKTGSLDFASYTHDAANGSTLSLSGVLLDLADYTATDQYRFGYCDVHANGSSTSSQYNPYSGPTGNLGGDPIDISWAVDDNGEPVNLSNIRYIRVYTGTDGKSSTFGEMSTEVKGSYAATDTGAGQSSLSPSVTLQIANAGNTKYLHHMTTTTDTLIKYFSNIYPNITHFNIQVNESSADYALVNGQPVTPGTFSQVQLTNGTQYVQIITQKGTEEPIVSVLKLE